MIAARKSRRFTRWFTRHARARLARTFERVRVADLGRLRDAGRTAPVLLVANHAAWWDALVALYLVEGVCGFDGYALMDATSLRRLPFFGLIGAFGVDRDRPADAIAAIRGAARLLARPGRAVLVFPQGREHPVTARPLGFHGGSALIARAAPAALTVPLALRYEFGAAERPEIWCAFGPPLRAAGDRATVCRAQEAAVASALDRIDTALCSGADADFTTVLTGRPRPLARVAERLLALATRASA